MSSAAWRSLPVKKTVKKISTGEKKIKQKETLSEGTFPVIDQGQSFIAGYYNDPSRVVDVGPVVVFGDHTRAIKFVDFPFVPGADGTKVLQPDSELFTPKLFYYFLQCINFPDKGYARHYQHLEKELINIPPLNQQEKIVAKIEEIFSELESNIQNLEEGLDRCVALRASIIEQAYDKVSSKRVELSEITEVITDGDHQAPPKSDSGIPFIVISNIINNRVVLERSTRYVPEAYYNNLKDTRKARMGDVLYTVTGSYGTPALIESDDRFCFQRHIALLRPDTASVSSRYLFYALQTASARKQATAIATGTAQLTVPLTGLRKIKIPLAPLNKQKKLIERVELALTELEEITTAISSTIVLAKNMKQSILAKAFKGELV